MRASDPDFSVTETASIMLTGSSGVDTDADGLLSGTGLTKTGVGVYTLAAATPASLANELDALTFTPTTHQVAPGQIVSTGLTLVVNQNGVTVTAASNLTATAVNDPPVINGLPASQGISTQASAKVLSGVSVSDPDFGVTETATITLTGSNGTATDANGELTGTGLTKTSTGTYSLAAATPASLTSELDALLFVPNAPLINEGQVTTTGIKLAVSQNGATMAVSGSITATAPNLLGGNSLTVPAGSDWVLGTAGVESLLTGVLSVTDAGTLELAGNELGLPTITIAEQGALQIDTGVSTTTFADAASGSSTATGQLDFGSGITNQNLWFAQSGANLDVTVLGTTDQVDLLNWFSGSSSVQLDEIKAGGLEVDTGFGKLIAAMAAFTASDPLFIPELDSQMPTNTNLQTAIAAAWHS